MVKTSKTRHLKTRYSDAVGSHPIWDDVETLDAEAILARWRHGIEFYKFHHKKDIKMMRPFIVEILSKLDGVEWDLEAFKALPDWQIPMNLCSICKMVGDGAPWQEDSLTYVKNKAAELLAKGKELVMMKTVDVPGEAKVVKSKNFEKIASELIGEIDYTFIDPLIRDGAPAKVSVISWLRQKAVPKEVIGNVELVYATQFAEILDAEVQCKMAKPTDPDLAEGYSRWTKKDFKTWIEWYNNFFVELADYSKLRVSQRKAPSARKVKIKTPEQIAKKVKYLPAFEELGLKSVSPAEIVGATQLWVYNTKTRKLGAYHASATDQVLSVKGTYIIGLDTKLSVAKTLRKPKEQLADFTESGKVRLRTFLKDIKATEVKLNGKINKDTVLLRTVR